MLKDDYPELYAEMYWPDPTITHASKKKVWWKCSTCSYEWKTKVRYRSYGAGCPGCNRRATTESNSLMVQHPDLYEELIFKDWTLSVGTGKRVWWKCSTCSYEWKVSVSHRSKGRGCSSCAPNGNATTESNSLMVQHPDLYEELIFKDWTLSVGTNQAPLWKCSTCSHEWKAPVQNRVKGSGCPKCHRKTGAVYIITQQFLTKPGIEAVKVGIVQKSKTRTPHESCQKRLGALQYSSAQPLELLHVYAGGHIGHERKIHAELEDIRANGEWFIVDGDPDTLSRIERVCRKVIYGIELVDSGQQLSIGFPIRSSV